MKCPLCSSNAQLDEILLVTDIVKLWLKLNVSVKKLFKVDTIQKYKCQNCGIGFFQPFIPGDDLFYGKLAELDWYYKHSGKTEYDYASKIIKSGMKVIDVGCGIGEFSSYIPVGAEFLGAELSSKSVEIAETLGRCVKKINIVNDLPKLEGKFDIVTCFQVLEHIVDIHEFFNALVKICRPGGKIIIAVPNNDSFLMSATNNIFNLPPHHLIHWNNKSIHNIANRFGLVVEEYVEERVTPVHLRWFYATNIHKFFMKLFGMQPKVMDRGFIYKLTYKISDLIALPLSYFFRSPNKPGHSLIIVLSRPNL